ncbi:MAG TPA: acyltransferase [Polyangiaceae bacterium]|nr:acyltransferase [Polyangiaceae bacterium]
MSGLAPGVHAAAVIHPTAVIDAGALIGAGTHVWHFCHVMGKAQIGAAVMLGQNCFVADGVRIGDGARIQNNVSLYDGVVIEQDVFIGPSAVFTNVKNPRATVRRRGHFSATRVGRGATVGANATIVCGVELGEYCFVGAGAVVTHDVPPYALVLGVPARQTGWVSRHAEPLRFDGDGRARCPASGSGYRLVDGHVAFEGA